MGIGEWAVMTVREGKVVVLLGSSKKGERRSTAVLQLLSAMCDAMAGGTCTYQSIKVAKYQSTLVSYLTIHSESVQTNVRDGNNERP